MASVDAEMENWRDGVPDGIHRLESNGTLAAIEHKLGRMNQPITETIEKYKPQVKHGVPVRCRSHGGRCYAYFPSPP